MLKIGVVGPTFPPIDSITRITRSIEDKGYDSLWFPDHLMGWFPHTMWTPELMGPLSMNSPHTFFETTLSIRHKTGHVYDVKPKNHKTAANQHRSIWQYGRKSVSRISDNSRTH